MYFKHGLVKSCISHERDYQIWHCMASHKYKHDPPYHLSQNSCIIQEKSTKRILQEDCKMILLLGCNVVTTRQPAPPVIQGDNK